MPDNNINIPGYDIFEAIGKGGMASVFRAKQHTFDRDVALKVLHANLSDDGNFSQRFLMESMIIAKLHHSHIVHVYDVGEIYGNHYIAMEFLSGGSLHERLQQGVALKDIISIVQQMASALDYAHQKGIVHRDIKPDNVMFRDDGAAVLTDFGIAKDTDTDVTLTQVGSVIGTPKYMSPEQIRGANAKPVSDIYSLGVVFYQMLTGRVPYSGEDMVATAFMHINDPIPRLPPSLQRFQPVIDRMLAKQGSDRYQRGNEVVTALNRCQRNQSEENTTMEGTVDLSPVPNSSAAGEPSAESLALEEQASKPVARLGRWSLWGLATLLLAGILLWALLLVPQGADDIDLVQQQQMQRLLAQAEKNIADLNLKKPEHNNAYDKYQQVLSMQPQHPQALAGIQAIAQAYFELALEAKKANNWPQFKSYLDEVEQLNPSHEGWPELKQQWLAQENQRQQRSDQRQSSIENLGLELQIEGLLQGAAQDEREGRVNSPKGNNAYEKYQKILELNPAHALAKKKLAAIK